MLEGKMEHAFGTWSLSSDTVVCPWVPQTDFPFLAPLGLESAWSPTTFSCPGITATLPAGRSPWAPAGKIGVRFTCPVESGGSKWPRPSPSTGRATVPLAGHTTGQASLPSSRLVSCRSLSCCWNSHRSCLSTTDWSKRLTGREGEVPGSISQWLLPSDWLEGSWRWENCWVHRVASWRMRLPAGSPLTPQGSWTCTWQIENTMVGQEEDHRKKGKASYFSIFNAFPSAVWMGAPCFHFALVSANDVAGM